MHCTSIACCTLCTAKTCVSHHFICLLTTEKSLCPPDCSVCVCVCSIQALTSLAPSFLVKPPIPAPSWEECQTSDHTHPQTDTAHALASPHQLLNTSAVSYLYSTHRQQPLHPATELCMPAHSTLMQQHSMTSVLNHQPYPPVQPQLQNQMLQLLSCLHHRRKVHHRLRSTHSSKQQPRSQHRTSGTADACTTSAQQPITAVPRLQTGNEHLDGKLKIIGAWWQIYAVLAMHSSRSQSVQQLRTSWADLCSA